MIVIGKGQDTKQKTRKMSRYRAGQDWTKKEPMNKTQSKKQEENKIQGRTRPDKTEPIVTAKNNLNINKENYRAKN